MVLLIVGLLIVGSHFFHPVSFDVNPAVCYPLLSEHSIVRLNTSDFPDGFYLLPAAARRLAKPLSPGIRPHPRLAPLFFLPIPINECDEELLATIPGIGPVLAGRIMQYRLKHGTIKSLDEFLQIKGIGVSKLHEIRDGIVI